MSSAFGISSLLQAQALCLNMSDIIGSASYISCVQEAKRSVADTVGKMFRECWKLDNPEAAVLIEALALQAELPIALQPDVEEAVKYIRQNGPRRYLTFPASQ